MSTPKITHMITYASTAAPVPKPVPAPKKPSLISQILAAIIAVLSDYFTVQPTPSAITIRFKGEIHVATGVQESLTFAFSTTVSPTKIASRTLTTTADGGTPVVQPLQVTDTTVTLNFAPDAVVTGFITETNTLGAVAVGPTTSFNVPPATPSAVTITFAGEIPATS